MLMVKKDWITQNCYEIRNNMSVEITLDDIGSCDYREEDEEESKSHCTAEIDDMELKPDEFIIKDDNVDDNEEYSDDNGDDDDDDGIAMNKTTTARQDMSIIQENLPQDVMFECSGSNYQGYLKNDRVTLEVQMFKCNNCDYQAKQKVSLQIHMLKHQDPSQVQIFKCDLCSYQTKVKAWSYSGKIMQHT